MTNTVKRKRELGVEARDTRDLRILFAPALIVVVGVGIFPLVFALIVSFQQWEPFFRSHPFNAGANFSEVWNDDVFHTSAINTALFVTVVVPIQTVLGFGLALIVESRLRLQRFFFLVASEKLFHDGKFRYSSKGVSFGSGAVSWSPGLARPVADSFGVQKKQQTAYLCSL